MDAIEWGFIVYLLIILFVGFYTARLTKNIKDFALGGNKLGPRVIAFSERASGESAWLLIGLPGAAMIAGLLEIWTVVGCIGGIIFSWIMIAKRLRVITEKYNAITLPGLFSKRFNDTNGMLRLTASLIITFFFTFYVAAQFSGAGKVLNVTFGFSQMQGMFIGAAIIIFYTLMGGFLAVAWTDLVQGIIMIGTLVILPVVGFVEILDLENANVTLDFSNLFGGKTGFAAFIAAIGGLSWGLGYMGQPHLVARYMAIDKPQNIKTARRIAILWAIPAFFGAMFIGIIGAKLISSGNLDTIIDQEKLMPMMAKFLLPSWLAGIFISGAIAAMMSTADSQLLVSTTVLTEDLIGKSIRSAKIDKLVIGRILTIIIGIFAFILAWQSTDLVFEMVSYAWGGLGAAFGPSLLLTLWWKKTSKMGVLFGMFSGTLFTIFDITQGLVTQRLSAFLIAFVCVIMGSFLFPHDCE